MKKSTPYILIAVLIGALLFLFVSNNKKSQRKLDERVTLKRQDKIPYGTYVAFENLPHLFPKASIYTSRQVPGYWDSLSYFDTRQAYIVVTKSFDADEDEMDKLISFAQKGNDVFISAQYISATADRMLKCASSSYDLSIFGIEDLNNNMKTSLATPPYEKTMAYSYPGKSFNSYFTTIDSFATNVLGYDGTGRLLFIHLRTGKGNFFIHLEPLAFSNYFLLHKNNIDYYEKALSVIDPATKKIVWDEYYIRKPQSDRQQEKKGWFKVLINMENEDGKKPFRAAFWLAIALLLLYVLMEMRRRQRYIPLIKKPKNESLDFVKTIGRLYYDKGDHRNLCKKMSAYFLEHVRNKYKLATGNLDEEFIKNLRYKSGAEEGEISQIISFINHIDTASAISQNQLTGFYKQLETFYQNT